MRGTACIFPHWKKGGIYKNIPSDLPTLASEWSVFARFLFVSKQKDNLAFSEKMGADTLRLRHCKIFSHPYSHSD
jgi:hypothetical protein